MDLDPQGSKEGVMAHPCPAVGTAQHRELQHQEVSVQLPRAQPTLQNPGELHLPGRAQVESGPVIDFPHTP